MAAHEAEPGAAAVTPTRQELEYLLRVIEAGAGAVDAHRFFLWTQGQLQALLPHRVLVGVRCAPDGQPTRIECVHGAMLDDATLQRLRAPRDGLAARIARGCPRGSHRLVVGRDAGGDAGDAAPGDAQSGAAALPASADRPDVRADLADLDFDNVLVGGTGHLADGASVVMLFDVPGRPHARHAYFLDLLLPHLHLALMRLPSPRAGGAPPRPLSAREAAIMGWLQAGKSNREIGQILNISALTVKNHLQRIYRLLGVSNRAHALARCLELRLLAR